MTTIDNKELPSTSGLFEHKAPTILFVNYGWRESGGGTIYPRAVAMELAQRGYKIAVMYASLEQDSSNPPYTIHSNEEDGIRLFGIINRPALFIDPDNPGREIDDPAVRKAFCQVLKLVRPDIVHFHNFHGLSFNMAEETYRQNIPCCFTPHNYHLIDPELYLLKNGLMTWKTVDTMIESEAVQRNPELKSAYLKRMETTRRLMNQWIDITLAVSQRQRKLLIDYGADAKQIAVIHQISPMADILWQNPDMATTRKHEIGEPLQIGYIGSLIGIKGVLMLVTALQTFTSKQVELHLYGDGNFEYKEQLKVADKNGILTFHGKYALNDLTKIAQQIDVAVIPSLVEESAPTLVLSELFAMRIPVIASDIGGIPEFVSQEVDGFLYQPYDIDSLIGHLTKFVHSRELLTSMRRNLVAPTHTFAAYMERLEELYNQLISGIKIDVEKISLIAPKRKPLTNKKSSNPRISWHGALFTHHSLAVVNRELCAKLMDSGFEIAFKRSEEDQFSVHSSNRLYKLYSAAEKKIEDCAIEIRHQWPPDFSPVKNRKLVLIQPWEFGSPPAKWVSEINKNVDELWVPSSFVRDCYITGGVCAEKVAVVPNGVATEVFNPSGNSLPLPSKKSFRFLFVGGTIHRKGIDLLLAAYSQAFNSSDNVSLVIKDMGGKSIYKGQTAQDMIAAFSRYFEHPEIIYLDDDFDSEKMASLYRACHVLVHPYRGEGFGLPIAEAMACGLAPIVTAAGAALDFCPPDIAWLIPAEKRVLPEKKIGNLETVDFPWLFEADVEKLTAIMRHAFENKDEVKKRGAMAHQYIETHFTWTNTAKTVERRLLTLAGKQDHLQQLPVLISNSCTKIKAEESANEDSVKNNQLQAICLKAQKLAQQGNLDGAIDSMLNEGIRLAPESPTPYLLLIKLLVSGGRYEDALGVVSELPASTDVQIIKETEAECFYALGDGEKALQAANAAGETSATAKVVLGSLAARNGDYDLAEQRFRQAIAFDSTHAKAWLSLGMLLWSMGKLEESWQAVKQAVTLDPLNDESVRIMRDMAERLC